VTSLEGERTPRTIGGSWGARVERARRILREGGVRLLAEKLLGETVLRRQVLVALDLGETRDAPPSRLQLDFGYLPPDDVDDYLGFHPFAGKEDVAARLARGERCFVARRRGRLVSCLWVAPRGAPIADLTLWVRVGRDEVYVYDAYTEPASRGWGVYPAAATELARRLAEEGYVRMIGVVRLDADRARKAHEQSGYRHFGSVGWLGMGPLRREFQVCRVERAHGQPQAGPRRWVGARLRARDLGSSPSGAERGSRVECADLSEAHVEAYLALRRTESRDEVQRRVESGDRCVVALSGGRVAAAAWIAGEGPRDSRDDCIVRAANGEAVVYDRSAAPGPEGAHAERVLAQCVLDQLRLTGHVRVVFVGGGARGWGGRAFGIAGRYAFRGRERDVSLTKRVVAPDPHSGRE
jgi:hypothetical protein